MNSVPNNDDVPWNTIPVRPYICLAIGAFNVNLRSDDFLYIPPWHLVLNFAICNVFINKPSLGVRRFYRSHSRQRTSLHHALVFQDDGRQNGYPTPVHIRWHTRDLSEHFCIPLMLWFGYKHLLYKQTLWSLPASPILGHRPGDRPNHLMDNTWPLA